MDLLVRCTGISRHYRSGAADIRALSAVSLTVRRAEYVAITGRSGSGKSTLLGIMGLLDQMDSGSYELAGRDVARLSEDKRAMLRRRELGFVFQFPALLSRASALENVELPLVYAGCPLGTRRHRALLALERVGLAHRQHHWGNQLSGGEQQRVAIARAIVNDPALVLADEPTGALDSRTAAGILSLLADLHRDGRTILIVTHAQDVAAAACRQVVLHDGSVVHDGARPPQDHAEGDRGLAP